MVNAGIAVGQTNDDQTVAIASIQELKKEIGSSSFQELMFDMESWFPVIVSNTSWNTQISDHFLINYYIEKHDEDDRMFDSLLLESERIYGELNYFFEMEANSKQDILAQNTRLLSFIIKIESDITFGFLNDPHIFFFYLDTKNTPDYMEKFRHEYAHWVWGRSFGEAQSFLYEGVATYAERMSDPQSDISNLLSQHIDLDHIPPLAECLKNEVFWQQKGMYTAGSLFIHYLVETWGWEELKALFLLTDFEDPDIQKQFYQIYELDLETVDRDWRSFIKTMKLRPLP